MYTTAVYVAMFICVESAQPFHHSITHWLTLPSRCHITGSRYGSFTLVYFQLYLPSLVSPHFLMSPQPAKIKMQTRKRPILIILALRLWDFRLPSSTFPSQTFPSSSLASFHSPLPLICLDKKNKGEIVHNGHRGSSTFPLLLLASHPWTPQTATPSSANIKHKLSGWSNSLSSWALALVLSLYLTERI